LGPDPGGVFDDSKLTSFGCFSPSDKASDWIANRLAKGPTGIGAWGSAIQNWWRHCVGTV
jgi:hypothetical protein